MYPSKENVFRCFRETPFNDVRIVMLGQDPYHDGRSVGLAFANENSHIVPSPSLKIILQEVEDSVYQGFDFQTTINFDLTSWAHQGVLLLNTALTVQKGKAGSHTDNWVFFTRAVLKALTEGHTGLIYMLWGNHAKSYKHLINPAQNFILEAAHPAAEAYGSGGFLGCGHFVKCNEILKACNSDQIKW